MADSRFSTKQHATRLNQARDEIEQTHKDIEAARAHADDRRSGRDRRRWPRTGDDRRKHAS